MKQKWQWKYLKAFIRWFVPEIIAIESDQIVKWTDVNTCGNFQSDRRSSTIDWTAGEGRFYSSGVRRNDLFGCGQDWINAAVEALVPLFGKRDPEETIKPTANFHSELSQRYALAESEIGL